MANATPFWKMIPTSDLRAQGDPMPKLRHHQFLLIVHPGGIPKLPYGKRAKPLAKTAIRLLFAYRKYLKTITTDNGSEFAAHLDITAGLRMKGFEDIKVYLADSYCSWQKGAVENVNKFIRQYS